MAALIGLAAAADISSGLLYHYVREGSLAQTEQERPLLRFLMAGQKTVPGGNLYISKPVRGASMNDTAGFFAGYQEDDSLSFATSANIQRSETRWYECHAGLIITWTELKKDGISIADHGKKSENAGIAVDRLTGLLSERLEDFGDAWSRAKNSMLWGDGSQDSKAVPGVRYWLSDANTTGTKGGLSRATYSWWRQNCFLGLAYSEADQTLTKTLRAKQRILRKRGGRPNKFLAGNDFITALESELQSKGEYTNTGFASGKNDIGMADISLRGVGNFEYDPTLDDLNMSNYCFEFDSRRLVLQPLAGEDNKLLSPERPYNYAVFLQSMTFTGALTCNQLNCHAVWSVNAAAA